MSTWLSSFNPFNSDSDEDNGDDRDSSPTGGVKHDLSALSKTLSNHFRGVASFLAPPPPSSSTPQPPDFDDHRASATAATEETMSASFTGIKNDLVEIGGSIKSLLSSSSNKAVFGITRFASNILQFSDDEEQADHSEAEDTSGIDEEVVAFVRKVSSRPELWTDFPISLPSDFDMSDSQREHAAVIEELVPSLETLRQNMSSQLSNGQFWMIYFILLLPRLSDTDMELLSSPEIIQMREELLLKLQNKGDAQVETSSSENDKTSEVGRELNVAAHGDEGLSRQKDIASEAAHTAGELQEIETGKARVNLEDEESGPCKSSRSLKHSENVDAVSFSDLEDDGNNLSDRLSGLRPTQSARGSSASESNEWVRLNENSGAQGNQTKAGLVRGKDSEGEESNDWFTVDDVDLDSLTAV